MKILIVGDWDAGGGVLTVIRDLAYHLQHCDVTYSVFFFNKGENKSPWWDFCDQVYYNQDITLTELLIDVPFDLVHVIDTACPRPYDTNRWLRRACYQGAVLCNIHVCTPVLPPDQFAHVFVACSVAARDAASTLISQEILIIPNGVNTAIFSPRQVLKPERPVLAWVGRASDERKDVSGFLYMAARFAHQYDFWIVASGELPVEATVQDWLGAGLVVRHDLNREQLAEFYSQVALSGGAIVSTSMSESFHLASLEAAACGCPIILPRLGWSAHIENGVNGLLYERSDGLHSFAKCLVDLQDNHCRDTIIAGAFHSINQQYNSKRMADQYYEVYQKTIAAAERHKTKSKKQAIQRLLWYAALNGRRRLRRVKAKFKSALT